jgi:hypothetical protein
VESLTIKKNGCLLDDVERESWQDFVKEIIPLGLSQLMSQNGIFSLPAQTAIY